MHMGSSSYGSNSSQNQNSRYNRRHQCRFLSLALFNLMFSISDSSVGPTQPLMMTFKQFLAQNDDNVDDSTELVNRYEEYKWEFKRRVISDFFTAHKDEAWYVPITLRIYYSFCTFSRMLNLLINQPLFYNKCIRAFT